MKQTEEKAKGGRKRTHLVKVYLNDAEHEKLCKDSEQAKFFGKYFLDTKDDRERRDRRSHCERPQPFRS